MRKGKSKKVLMTALALAVGASAPMAAKASQDGLFNINEVSAQPILIAGKEGSCGGKDGSCGSHMKGKEGTCGVKKMMKKMFGKKDKKAKANKKETTTKAKADGAEAKCGEGTCG
ncbi:MAG: hypothetical protein HYZ79_01620 [Candidatus Melainabacteria bacterium]|nr:hypothetical protein [Candidatus Melainabacteria bacterium]